MAITMSGATVDQSERDGLLASTVDMGVTSGGASANSTWYGRTTGASLAGVTASFATNVSGAIDDYAAEIMSKLNNLENANSEVAFKGDAVKGALTSFINAVKQVSVSYLDKLKAAETQIVNSVATVYQSQDSDLAANLNADSSTLESNSI